MSRALVFPGQGSQAVGMGRELAECLATAREVFEEVDDALGQRLSRLMFEGPEDELVLTANAQPALMAVSVAVARVLTRDAGFDLTRQCRFVAGHSLGEYSALCVAGAMNLADTARLLRLRGQAMQQAVPVGVGAMAALLGLDLEQAREVTARAAEGEVLDIGNDNAPGQVVVSGHAGAVERAIEVAKELGARRPMRLPVSAPFHCRLMQPAAEAMQEALERTTMRGPAVPLVANVTAAAVRDPDEIRRLLVEQVTGMVRWRESVLFMKQGGVEHLVELGSGRVLSGLARRIDPELTGTAVGRPQEIDAFVKTL
jgi:[acyl-carrier-protein] S-malonyltransferase